jgi:ABC-type glycerol-3-phosphate transport system permease component
VGQVCLPGYVSDEVQGGPGDLATVLQHRGQWPLLVPTQTKSRTIPVGLSSLIGGSAIQYTETTASAVLGILPLLAVLLLLQRQIVQGVSQTGIK